MTEKRNLFQNFLFKISLSLFMAFIMFFSVPVNTYAAQVAGGALSISGPEACSSIPLSFFGNFTLDGSDRDSFIPYAFRGSVTMPFQFLRSNGSAYYNYVNGRAYKIVTFKQSAQIAGFNNAFINVALANVSMPEGVSVSLQISNLVGGTTTCILSFSFTNFDVTYARTGSITLDIDFSGNAVAHDFGSSYMYAYVTATPAADYVDQGLTFYDSLFTPDVSYFRSMANNIFNSLQSIYARQADINSSVNTVGSNIVNKIQSQMDNDNAIKNALLNQISNEGLLIRRTASENSQNEINTANKNSQAEIDTANKNADDIMHSYDSGSQESDNKRFDDSQKQLQETEDNLFGSASGYFEAIKFDDYLSTLNVLASSLSFVSGLMQTIYIKSGVFGVIVTISLVVMIASKVVGLYRFSTGGDKGG